MTKPIDGVHGNQVDHAKKTKRHSMGWSKEDHLLTNSML